MLAAGGLWTLEDAQRAFAAGVDVAILGRAAIGNPDWPLQARPGWAPLRPPFDPDQLREAAVGEASLDYLGRFSGMLTPP